MKENILEEEAEAEIVNKSVDNNFINAKVETNKIVDNESDKIESLGPDDEMELDEMF